MMMMTLNLGFDIYTVLQISVRLYQISSQKKSFLGTPNIENSGEFLSDHAFHRNGSA